MRLHVPPDGATVVHDVVRGDTRFEHVHLDDPVIARADGSVLYNFAVAIDDLDAGITHVVRGEDHLSNTPKQVLVLEAMREAGLAGDAPLPVYAHLPLLHGPDGKKLSKRHGAASVQELRDQGFLPEAVRNYLALLGWGAGDDETVLDTQELIERFTLERVSRNPARFDEVKLRWLNGIYIRKLPVEELTRPAGRVHRAHRPAPGGGDQPGEDPDAGGLLAARGSADRRARGRPGRAREVAGRGRAGGAGGRPPLTAGAVRVRRARRGARAGADNRGQGRQTSPGLPAPARRDLRPTVSPGIFESVALLGREETLGRIDEALSRA